MRRKTKRMNFGIIGMGDIGNLHAKVISGMEEANLAAISSRNEEKLKDSGKEYTADCYTDYRELLKREDIDIVNICTASGTHADIGFECLEAGKHILVEKPVDISLPKLDRLIAEAQKKELKIGCIFQLRFFEDSQRVKKAIEAIHL
jgi:predicted dehydrogenase